MSPLAIALAVELLGAFALLALFALFRGPDTGPGKHRRAPRHRAPEAAPVRARAHAEPTAEDIAELLGWPVWKTP